MAILQTIELTLQQSLKRPFCKQFNCHSCPFKSISLRPVWKQYHWIQLFISLWLTFLPVTGYTCGPLSIPYHPKSLVAEQPLHDFTYWSWKKTRLYHSEFLSLSCSGESKSGIFRWCVEVWMPVSGDASPLPLNQWHLYQAYSDNPLPSLQSCTKHLD